jgi:adenylate cyclase
MSSMSETRTANPTRELAAIMFSDIAGYTLVMGRDEDKAIRALAAHRELLRDLLPRFKGRMLGEIGDGTLSSFHSAVDAVNCAREVQAALKNDPALAVRIGIHVGDVIFSPNNVLGDGVNIASRIHALAEPGGICISERVYEDIRNKPEIRAKLLGEKTLKNVSHTIKVYAITDASSALVLGRISGPVSVATRAAIARQAWESATPDRANARARRGRRLSAWDGRR